MEDGDGLAEALGGRRPRRAVLVAVVLPWLVVGAVLLRDVPARFAVRAPATDPASTARPTAAPTPPTAATPSPTAAPGTAATGTPTTATTSSGTPSSDGGSERGAGSVEGLDVAGVLLAARRAVERGVLPGTPGATDRRWPLDLVVVGVEGPGGGRAALVAGTALRGGPDGWDDLTRVSVRVPVDADGRVAGAATSADGRATPVDVPPTPVDPGGPPGRPGPSPTSTPTERAR